MSPATLAAALLGAAGAAACPLADAQEAPAGSANADELAKQLSNPVAGDDDRADVDATYFQPFLTKAIGQGGTITVNFESICDF